MMKAGVRLMQGKAQGAPRHSLAWAGLFLALFLAGGLAGAAGGDQSDPPVFEMPKTGMKSGRITAKHERSVEISGRQYGFHPQVAFWTDEGQQLEWKEFRRGDEVRFHLKREQIDLLVLEMPK